jgi:hypothetical protein
MAAKSKRSKPRRPTHSEPKAVISPPVNPSFRSVLDLCRGTRGNRVSAAIRFLNGMASWSE